MEGHSFLAHHGIYGLMAEFEHPEELVEAAQHAYAAGYRKMEGYSPLPVPGLSEAIGFKRHFVSLVVFCGGLTGCIGGFTLMWWMSVVAFAHNVAGHPMNSWPS